MPLLGTFVQWYQALTRRLGGTLCCVWLWGKWCDGGRGGTAKKCVGAALLSVWPPADRGGSGAEVSGGGGMSSGPGTERLRDSFIVGGWRCTLSSSVTPLDRRHAEHSYINCTKNYSAVGQLDLLHLNLPMDFWRIIIARWVEWPDENWAWL